jgi:hypothetical protein
LAQAVIREENIWNKERMRDTTEGMKETYQCKVRDCKRKCYLLFNSDSEQVSLRYNDIDHNHDGIKAKTLQGMLIPNPNKEDTENPFIENPNFVEGLDVPQKLQIKNYLQNIVIDLL